MSLSATEKGKINRRKIMDVLEKESTWIDVLEMARLTGINSRSCRIYLHELSDDQ